MSVFEIGILVYVLLVFISVFYNIKFHLGKKSRDERGEKIANRSYSFIYLLIIFAWLILSFIDEYIYSFSLDIYTISIFFLLISTNIIVSIIIFNLKRTA